VAEPPLAIIADNYRIATQVAAEFGLNPREADGRTWFYVMSERQIFGRRPGRYVIRLTEGARLTGQQMAAWEYMIARGWRERS